MWILPHIVWLDAYKMHPLSTLEIFLLGFQIFFFFFFFAVLSYLSYELSFDSFFYFLFSLTFMFFPSYHISWT